jgi:hypothetical protein
MEDFATEAEITPREPTMKYEKARLVSILVRYFEKSGTSGASFRATEVWMKRCWKKEELATRGIHLILEKEKSRTDRLTGSDGFAHKTSYGRK